MQSVEVGRRGQILLCSAHGTKTAYIEGSDVEVRSSKESSITVICNLGYLEILFIKLGKIGKRQE